MHYTDMVDYWVDGEYFPLLFLRHPDDVRDKQFYSIQLTRKR